MSVPKVAFVTGSNKGIGLAVVRAMCKQFPGDVYLTARDVGRGTAAVESLKAEGLHPLFHQLDITDSASVRVAQDFLKEKYGGLDVLINNAGIAFKSTQTGDSHLFSYAHDQHNRHYILYILISGMWMRQNREG